MKQFKTQISLWKYLEMGGTLEKGQILMCNEHYPCKYLGKRLKNWRNYPEDEPIKVIQYKIEFLENTLYTAGKISDVLESDLYVPLLVKDWETYTLEEKSVIGK